MYTQIDPEFFPYFIKLALDGLPFTAAITIVAMIIGTILGLIIAFIRNENIPILSNISIIVVSFLRGTPLYIQLLLIYFAIPMLLESLGFREVEMSGLISSYIAYGLNASSYLSETFRSSIVAISKSQYEAAYSLGFNKFQTYLKIILPQAFKNSIPNYGTILIGIFQGTSVAFSIGVLEIVGKIRTGINLQGRSVEGYIVAAVLFIIFTFIFEMIFKLVSKRLEYKHV